MKTELDTCGKGVARQKVAAIHGHQRYVDSTIARHRDENFSYRPTVMTLASASAFLPTRPLSRLAAIGIAGSAALLIGALGFQYIGGLPPCELCHWQRYVHVGVVILGVATLAAASRPDLQAVLLGLTIAGLVGSAGLAGYHAAVEWGWLTGPQSCTGDIPRGLSPDKLRRWLMERPPVRCDVVPWSLLGLSMAGWNFVASLVLASVLGIGTARRGAVA